MVVLSARSLTGPAKGVFQLIRFGTPLGARFWLHNFAIDDGSRPDFDGETEGFGVPVSYFLQRRRLDWRIGGEARTLARENGVNIVQTHGYKPSLLGLYLKLRLGLKWICFMHGVTFETLRLRGYYLLDNLLQRFADRVVLVSEAQRCRVPWGRNPHRVRVIHNAVDGDAPVRGSDQPSPTWREIGLEGKDRLVTYVGRLSYEKGVDVLLEAFAGVVGKLPGAALLIVGDGRERARLERQARSLGIEKGVCFHGYEDSPGRFMAASDLIVLPSRSEASSNVLLEGMALGKPLVATAVGGTPEILQSGVSGLLVPPESSEALADAMLQVLRNRDLASRLATCGRERVKREFSPEGRARAICALYEDLLEDP